MQRRFYTVADAAYATGPAPSRAPRFRLKVYDAILLIIIVPTCRVCALRRTFSQFNRPINSKLLSGICRIFWVCPRFILFPRRFNTPRWKVVHNRLKKKGLPTVKRLSDTRWSAHAAAVKAVVKGYEEIKAGLKGIAADPELKETLEKKLLITLLIWIVWRLAYLSWYGTVS